MNRIPVPLAAMIALVLVSSIRAQNAGNLSGLYWAYFAQTSFSYDFQGNPQSVSEYKLKWYFFAPSGRVYKGIPPGGLETFDCAANDAKGKPLCVPYRVAGSTIQFGSEKPVKFGNDGAKLEIAGQGYTSVQKLDGLKLNATYNGTAFSTTTGVSATNTLSYTFKTDGTFSRQSASTVSGATDPNNARDSSVDVSLRETSSVKGAYQFKGNTLELTLEGGQRVRLTAAMLFADRSWLVLNARTFRSAK